MNPFLSRGMSEEMLNKRLYFELGKLIQLQKEEPAIQALSLHGSDPLVLRMSIFVREHNYDFEMTYPRYFPFQPIIIKALTMFHTAHIYRDKSMCLKWGNDNWHEEVTGKQMVENLIELLSVENPLGDVHGIVESGHQITLGQRVTQNGGTLFLSKGMIDLFKKKRGVGQLYVRSINSDHPGGSTYFLKSIGRSRHFFVPNNRDTFDTVKFEYVQMDMSFEQYRKLDKKDQLIHTKSDCTLCIYDDQIVLFRKTRANEENRSHFIEWVRNSDSNRTAHLTDDEVVQKYVIMFQVSVVYVEDERESRNRIANDILRKKITIFGLGSVGSRVLVDLARAGFHRFHLVDDDLFLPSNLSRHELSLEHIGEFKTHELSNYLHQQINPMIEIEIEKLAVNGQHSATTIDAFFDSISDTDIIIDCTADSNLIFTINEFVKEKDLPYVSGSVLSGGLGNILIKRDVGSPLSVVDILETQKKYMRMNALDQFFGNDYTGTYGTKEYVATMSDVSIIAGLIGKTVIRMLSDDSKDVMDHDIHVMSTSNGFLGGFYNSQPIIAHKRNFTPMPLDPEIVRIGKEYHDDHSTKKNQQNFT
jgi:ubiquitin-protein ligase